MPQNCIIYWKGKSFPMSVVKKNWMVAEVIGVGPVCFPILLLFFQFFFCRGKIFPMSLAKKNVSSLLFEWVLRWLELDLFVFRYYSNFFNFLLHLQCNLKAEFLSLLSSQKMVLIFFITRKRCSLKPKRIGKKSSYDGWREFRCSCTLLKLLR